MIDPRQQQWDAVVRDLATMRDAIDAVVAQRHDDNTGAPCRIDLDGHDCCYVCNYVEYLLTYHRGVLAKKGIGPDVVDSWSGR